MAHMELTSGLVKYKFFSNQMVGQLSPIGFVGTRKKEKNEEKSLFLLDRQICIPMKINDEQRNSQSNGSFQTVVSLLLSSSFFLVGGRRKKNFAVF